MFKHFSSLLQGECLHLFFLNLKKRETECYVIFHLSKSKNLIFFYNCSLMYFIRKVSANNKNIHFLSSLCFFENENSPSRSLRDLPIFWNRTHKNRTDQQQYVLFRKKPKSARSLHPIVHVYQT